MFTNNYKNYREMMFFNKTKSFVNADGTTKTGYPETSYYGDFGALMSKGRCRAITAYQTSTSFSANLNEGGIYFGTGSTPAAENDYKLESPITSGLSFATSECSTSKDADGKYSVIVAHLVKNTTDQDINICEIGAFGEVAYKRSSSESQYNACLWERTVLAEPITIAPGETKVVTYKVTFNQTLNVE